MGVYSVAADGGQVALGPGEDLLAEVVLLGGGAWIAYKAQLSPEINHQVKLKIKN